MDLDQLNEEFKEGVDVILQPTLEPDDNTLRENSESEVEISSASEDEGNMPLATPLRLILTLTPPATPLRVSDK